MGGLFRDWFRRLRTKTDVARIARQCGLSADSLHEDLTEISGERRRFVSVRLGGVNNEGMFLHLCNDTGKPLALSKVQAFGLAQREALFMRWQEKQGLSLSGRCLNMLALGDSEYAVLCSEYLSSPATYSARSIHQLHNRFHLAAPLLHLLGTPSELTGLVVADTPIKRVLRGLVTQPADARIDQWCDDFLQQRAEVLQDHLMLLRQLFSAVADRWQSISSPVSLVHGDFKRQNILCGDDGEYRAIDLQYYLPGQSCWDLAFYYSKYDAGFVSAWDDFNKYSEESFGWQLQFVFFYIVAAIINVKPKRRNWVVTTKVVPAMKEMEKLLSNRSPDS
jgi:hypothetical protein